MFVIKRNGDRVAFDIEKITNAIVKANNETIQNNEEDYAKDVAAVVHDVVDKCKQMKNDVPVETIQEFVETSLMKHEAYDTAKRYIRYRYLHSVARNQYKDFMDALTEKITAANVQNQNANVDEHSFGGRVGETSDLVLKRYALDYCVSPMARENHVNNRIYIHDLNSYAVGSHNCLSVPLDDLLANGFKTRQTDVRPAQSVNTAFQLVAVLFQIQSLQQFGFLSK